MTRKWGVIGDVDVDRIVWKLVIQNHTVHGSMEKGCYRSGFNGVNDDNDDGDCHHIWIWIVNFYTLDNQWMKLKIMIMKYNNIVFLLTIIFLFLEQYHCFSNPLHFSDLFVSDKVSNENSKYLYCVYFQRYFQISYLCYVIQ